MAVKRISWLAAGAGLLGGGLALSLHQQTSFSLVSWACESKPASLVWAGAGAFLLLLASAALSWQTLRRINSTGADALAQDALRARRFLAIVGLFAAGLFFFALALQAAAMLFLPECQA